MRAYFRKMFAIWWHYIKVGFWILPFACIAAMVTHTQEPVNQDEHGEMRHEVIAGEDLASRAMVQAVGVPVNRIPAVLTRSYDNLRTGTILTETSLTPERVRVGLRQLFAVSVGGDRRGFEAQPLLVPNVQTVDGIYHDLLLVATMGNQVAAFDANDGTPLWLQRLGNPILGTRAIDAWDINDHWGILSTGVVHESVWYVVAWSSPDATQAKAAHFLYALNLKDGSRAKAPLRLTNPAPLQRKQRASLTLTIVNGIATVFIPWGTIQETSDGAHGYITAVDLANLKVSAELNITPNGKGGGIWHAGQGLVADAGGFLYAMTSNGTYDGVKDFSESFIKVRYDGTSMAVIDHYSPYRDSARSGYYTDQDLGSGGPSVIPELGLVFGAGKDGILYTLPWRKLKTPTIAPIWYTFYPGNGVATTPPPDRLFFDRTHHMHGSSVVWKTGGQWRVFCWGENGNLRAWRMDASGAHYLANGAEVASVEAKVPPGGMPGGFLALSANGQTDGVLWALVPLGDANRTVTQGYLAAYDATTFGKYGDGSAAITLLWKSAPFSFNKFMPPVVGGGKVYVPTYDGRVIVFAP